MEARTGLRFHCSNLFSYYAFLALVTTGIEPTCYSEVVKDESWRDAMRKEIQDLENNGTWTLETLPQGKKQLGTNVYTRSSIT